MGLWKKKNNFKQKIKLIEYCSRLSKSGQYKYNSNKEQNFAAIGCDCLDKDNNVYKENIEECSHASMLHDSELFQYIYSVVNDPKESVDDNIDSKKEAIKKYKKDYDYVGECNNDLIKRLDTAKWN